MSAIFFFNFICRFIYVFLKENYLRILSIYNVGVFKRKKNYIFLEVQGDFSIVMQKSRKQQTLDFSFNTEFSQCFPCFD